jgi:hypothetical protein
MACELHDDIVQAFVLEKSPLPLANMYKYIYVYA